MPRSLSHPTAFAAPRRARRRRAVTLLEMLVANAVLVVATGACLYALSAGRQVMAVNASQTALALAANAAFEELRAAGFDALEPGVRTLGAEDLAVLGLADDPAARGTLTLRRVEKLDLFEAHVRLWRESPSRAVETEATTWIGKGAP